MRRILIVDDNDAIRESLVDALGDEGYDVLAAADGHRAIALAEAEQPALILLDLMMPGLDGAAVAARLALDGCRSPVVVISADRAVADRAEQMGAAGFLAKPFDLAQLLAIIERITGPEAVSRRS